MKVYVCLAILVTVLAQVLCLPLNELTKRNYRRLVKSPQDMEELERELKQGRVAKKQDERGSPVPLQMAIPNDGEPTDHRQSPMPAELTDGGMGGDSQFMDAVSGFLQYMREHPYLLQSMLKTEENKVLRDWMSEQTGPIADHARFYEDLSPQLDNLPKKIEKKNGRGNNANFRPQMMMPGLTLQEGGEAQEEAERIRDEQVNKMFHQMQDKLSADNMLMHPIPEFDILPNPNAHDVFDRQSESSQESNSVQQSDESRDSGRQDSSSEQSNSSVNDEGDTESAEENHDSGKSAQKSDESRGFDAEEMRKLLAEKATHIDEDELMLGRLRPA